MALAVRPNPWSASAQQRPFSTVLKHPLERAVSVQFSRRQFHAGLASTSNLRKSDAGPRVSARYASRIP